MTLRRFVVPVFAGVVGVSALYVAPRSDPERDDIAATEPLSRSRSYSAPWFEAVGVPEPESLHAPVDAPLSAGEIERNGEAVALANAGRFAEAAAILRDLLARNPDSLVLRRNLQAALLGLAQELYERGELEAAEAEAEAAVDASPDAPSSAAWSLLGAIRRDLADPDGAIAAWHQALALDAGRADVALALAAALAEMDERTAALDLLLQFRESNPGNHSADAMIDRFAREVDAEWDFVRVETAYFRIDFDDSVADATVHFVANALDDAYRDVGAKLGVFPEEPATAVLYPDADFHALTQTRDWTRGVFDGRIKIPLAGLESNDPELPYVLRHEYAHAVIAGLSKGHCPAWLNEGLAMWAEETVDERRVWAEDRLFGGTVVPLDNLRSSFSRMSSAGAEAAYAQSYITVASLVDTYGVEAVVELLENLGDGIPFDGAFRTVIGRDFQSFEDDVQRRLLREYGVASRSGIE